MFIDEPTAADVAAYMAQQTANVFSQPVKLGVLDVIGYSGYGVHCTEAYRSKLNNIATLTIH